jgi:hypothetical protein
MSKKEKLTTVTFRIPLETNKAFHVKCVKEGRKMCAVLVSLIDAWNRGEVEL